MGHSLCSELMSFHDWLLSCGCSFACKSTNMTPGAHLAFAVSFSLTPYKLRRAAWKLPPPPRAVTAWICLSVFLASWPAIFLSTWVSGYLSPCLPQSVSPFHCLSFSAASNGCIRPRCGAAQAATSSSPWTPACSSGRKTAPEWTDPVLRGWYLF